MNKMNSHEKSSSSISRFQRCDTAAVFNVHALWKKINFSFSGIVYQTVFNVSDSITIITAQVKKDYARFILCAIRFIRGKMWKSGNHLHTIEAVRKTTALKNEFQPDLYETIIHKIFAQNISSCLLLLRFVIIIIHLGIYVHRVPSLDGFDFRRFSIIVHLFLRRVCVVYMCNWSVFVHLGSTVRAIECYCFASNAQHPESINCLDSHFPLFALKTQPKTPLLLVATYYSFT